jgi:shikimate dehydrogenase
VLHNTSFKILGFPQTFEALPLSPAQFEPFMGSLASSEYRGVAVTIPYKSSILPYCRVLDERVEAIGAANTLVVKPDGLLEAYNTDAGAASRALREAGAVPGGKRVVVLGAGGAGRAICFQMLWDGAAGLTVANRTERRARELEAALKRFFPGGERVIRSCGLGSPELAESLRKADILVNTTSVGMYPRVDESPVEEGMLHDRLVVFDIVYNPLHTRLLAAARARGAGVVPGSEMLLYQGVEQERLWLGIDPPVAAMRDALLKALCRSS